MSSFDTDSNAQNELVKEIITESKIATTQGESSEVDPGRPMSTTTKEGDYLCLSEEEIDLQGLTDRVADDT